ncbi:hypothetical protein L3X38_011127 [Prunus dulcis]|uniref:Reverse transcriptase Ty1/copia-type domain-containing protein n=1 Tax=Prunus dulcis TaxID=3755 RepID=A0AAD4ZF44_PRUDU|nr:hypothetical protein L3X38_011127 [Prunus dulcis]
MHASFPSSSPQEQFWVADTGATTHMTSDLSQLSLATPFSGSDTITTAGVSGLSISNIGSSILDVPQCSLQLQQDKITGSVLLKGLCRAGLLFALNLPGYASFRTATQSPLPVDPDFQPETLCVVLPLPAVNLLPMTTRSKNAWRSAMREEIEALHAQGTWDLVPLPPHKNLVGCKWVYRIKKTADGSIARHKVPLVAKGFSQEKGIDYSESFSPVVKPTTVHLVLALAVQFNWSLRQLDVKNAFLHGILQEETKYIKELLDKVDLQGSKPCATPCLPYHRSLKDDGKPYSHPKKYRSIVGALHYLTFTRPDIAFSANQAFQFMHNPWNLMLWRDADWAGDPNDQRSVSGFIVYLGSSPISWASKKQHTISRSSTEAEYRALAIAAAELVWIRQLFCDLHVSLHIPPLIHCDNISAISLASNPVFHSRMKHLQIDYHFVRERVIRGDLLVQHVSSADQFADILTKGLSAPLFQHQCSNLMLGSSKPAIEGECKDINGPSLATCHKIKESSG